MALAQKAGAVIADPAYVRSEAVIPVISLISATAYGELSGIRREMNDQIRRQVI